MAWLTGSSRLGRLLTVAGMESSPVAGPCEGDHQLVNLACTTVSTSSPHPSRRPQTLPNAPPRSSPPALVPSAAGWHGSSHTRIPRVWVAPLSQGGGATRYGGARSRGNSRGGGSYSAGLILFALLDLRRISVAALRWLYGESAQNEQRSATDQRGGEMSGGSVCVALGKKGRARDRGSSDEMPKYYLAVAHGVGVRYG
jgi:hypothetical protein